MPDLAYMKKIIILLAVCLTSTVAWSKDGDYCLAKKLYNDEGNYRGCKTNVNGHANESDAEGITEAGCESFCDSLDSSAGSEMPKLEFNDVDK